MQPTPATAEAITDLINWCRRQAVDDLAPEPLLANWFHCHLGMPLPQWLDMARHLFLHQQDDVHAVLRHALTLHRQRMGAGQAGSTRTAFQRQPAQGLEQAMAPEDILLYAANANGWPYPAQRLDPQDLTTRLLCTALSAADNAEARGPRVLEQLSLTQMLVHRPSRHHQGLLLSLDLQTLDSSTASTDDLTADHAGRFLPLPAAVLLQTDTSFRQGLAVAQDLLSRTLSPGAPAIGWRLSSLALPGDRIKSFSVIEGPSASAALAFGALYLLRHHLDTRQPHVARLAEHLHTIEAPATVSVTAELVTSQDPSQPWPLLSPVDGVPEKIAALATSLPTGRRVSHCFVATRQRQVATTPVDAEGAQHLGELVEKIAQATTSLDEDARQLHAALQQERHTLSDAAIAANPMLQAVMERLRSKTHPGTGVRAHLVWRYAQLCAGQPSPFGDVARLGQHFVSLSVEGPRGHGPAEEADEQEEDAPVPRRQDRTQLVCHRLQDILYPTEPAHMARWQTVPAWCIQAQPFSGKSTLIQHWELTRLRQALHAQAQGWGEVPVFLPMNAFMRHSRLSHPSADDLGRALRDYAQLLAPALPWSELLPDQAPTPAQLNTPRPDGLRVRLCIDALNEYRTGQANEGSAIRLLCDWLAPRCDPHRPGALLPPLFSVRREEAANFQLSARSHPGWAAHAITVHPWRPSQMRAYVLQRGLAAEVQTRLLQALQLPGPEADDDALRAADDQGPANDLARFSQVPGFLSAQCTLLERWPHLPLSGRRAHIMLALAWRGLDKWHHSSAFDDLQQRAANDPALAQLLRWLLPTHTLEQLQYLAQGQGLVLEWEPGLAGGLLEGLGRVADAMQDPHGGEPEESALWRADQGHAGLRDGLISHWPQMLGDDMPEQWLAQAVASGLVLKTLQQPHPHSRALPWLRFAHQQIQEFFAALSVTPQHLPDLSPPPFQVPTQDLDDYLRKEGSELELPAVTPHTERLRYAADLATNTGVEQLITAVLQQGNLALAAQLAVDQRARLEPPDDNSGRVVSHGFWFAERRHPLLQHLRARLLLASVDTGTANLPKLHASGILAGIADTVQDLPEPWRGQWAPLLPALRNPAVTPPASDPAPGWPAPLTAGVDLRQRLQYGLLLGELGDNIRYERCSAEVPVEGDPTRRYTRTGIRLKATHWALIPGSGPGVVHRIGSDREEDKGEDNHPAWTVPDGELPPALFAHTPAVVMQWQAFWEDPLAQRKPTKQGWALDEEDFANPLEPITTINWFTAQAFTAWAAPLHQPLANRLPAAAPEAPPPALTVPTEVQHEAAARFHPEQPRPVQHGWWPHDAADRSAPGDWRTPGDLPPTLFNHNDTRWGRPAPVSVFSAALSPSGIEAMGNVWTWCANVFTGDYQGDNARLASRPYTAATPEEWRERAQATSEDPPWLAQRGGSYYYSAGNALVACRNHDEPVIGGYFIGLRWVMCSPIF